MPKREQLRCSRGDNVASKVNKVKNHSGHHDDRDGRWMPWVFQNVHFWRQSAYNHVRHGRQDDFTLDIVVYNFQSMAYIMVCNCQTFKECNSSSHLWRQSADNHVHHGFPECTLLETIGVQSKYHVEYHVEYHISSW